MITQFQVDAFLKIGLPVLASQSPEEHGLSARRSIDQFLAYTSQEIKMHHKQKVARCFSLAEQLYVHGDVVVRLLIENFYVYYVSICLSRDQAYSRRWIKMMPPNLHRIFFKQQLSSGC